MLTSIIINKQFVTGLAVGIFLSIGVSVWKWKQKEEQKWAPRKIRRKIKNNMEMKMVIVIPKDLKLMKRELITQTSYACIGAVKECVLRFPNLVKVWKRLGQAKVALKVNNEAELLSVRDAAERENLAHFLVRDADPAKNNPLVLAIGPDFNKSIDTVTGHLTLY